MNEVPALAMHSVESLISQVTDDFMDRLDRGEQPEIEEYALRHPQIAAVLRQVLPALQVLRAPPPDPAAPSASPASGQLTSGCLGDFRLVREVGRGGMGVVYEAEQISLGRRVALKVLPFASTMDPRQLQRFQNEARAAASLHHTSIVPVYYVGCERGVHFYAMQFIDGQSLAGFLEQQCGDGSASTDQPTTAYTPSPAPGGPAAETAMQAAATTARSPRDAAYFRRVAEWGVQSAEALDHAHQMGIVHRDVKPANLLVDPAGRLWVTDFGLAQVQSDSRLTMTGDLIGTLRYMSPEQALARRVVIDHRTDVYSLGATLYELMTLRPVFDGSDRQELLRQIAFEEPPRPRRLYRAIPAELEIIVLKALEKNPADRYGTAQELADDLRRWLDDRPIQAKRPSLLQRARKWAQRHRVVMMAAALVLLVTVVALGVSAVLILAAYDAEVNARKDAESAWGEEAKQRENVQHERDVAQTEREEAKRQERLAHEAERHESEHRRTAEHERDASYRHLYLAHMQLAQGAWRVPNSKRVQALLDEYLPRPGRKDLRGWEWYHLDAVSHRELLKIKAIPRKTPFAIDWTPDGKCLAALGWEGGVSIWDATSGKEQATFPTPAKFGLSVAFSPDGRRLAVGGRNDRQPRDQDRSWTDFERTVTILDASDGQVIKTLTLSKISPPASAWPWHPVPVAWSPDSRQLAVSGDDEGTIIIWDRDGANKILTLKVPPDPVVKSRMIDRLAWSPDGRRLAAADGSAKVVWDAVTGKLVRNIRDINGKRCIAWHPSARLLAANTSAGLELVDATTGETVRTVDNVPGGVAGWSPDGNHLLFLNDPHYRSISVIDMQTLTVRNVLSVGMNNLRSAAWCPDGLRIASIDLVGIITVWDPYQLQERQRLVIPRGFTPSTWAWASEGRQFFTFVSEQGTEKNHAIRITGWDSATGRQNHSFMIESKERISQAFLSPDGGRVVYDRHDGDANNLIVWDIATGKKTFSLYRGTRSGSRGGWVGAWSPDGKRFAINTGKDGTIDIREMNGGQTILSLGKAGWLAWGSDGRKLVSLSGKKVTVWDPQLGKEIKTFPIQASIIHAPALSPDGNSLAIVPDYGDIVKRTDESMEIRLYDLTTGALRHSLRDHTMPVACLAWSPDGRRLASAGRDDTVKIWDVDSGEPLYTLRAQVAPNQAAGALSWSPDGKRLAATDHAEPYGVCIWDAARREPWHPTRAAAHNDLAWFLATCPEPQLRDPKRAVALAKQAVELAPQDGAVWNTLGVAQYRAGDGKGAAQALGKGMELRGGGNSADWFFLAMAHWQLGDKQQARKWHDQAVAWMEKNQPQNEELRRFRAEAAELLGIKDEPPAKDKDPPTPKP